jgi:hypothetical protein
MLEDLSSACGRGRNNFQNEEERQKDSNRNGNMRSCAEGAVVVKCSVLVHVRGLNRSSQQKECDTEHSKNSSPRRARGRSGAPEGHKRNYTLTLFRVTRIAADASLRS